MATADVRESAGTVVTIRNSCWRYRSGKLSQAPLGPAGELLTITKFPPKGQGQLLDATTRGAGDKGASKRVIDLPYTPDVPDIDLAYT
jgi:hypothetical protein